MVGPSESFFHLLAKEASVSYLKGKSRARFFGNNMIAVQARMMSCCIH